MSQRAFMAITAIAAALIGAVCAFGAGESAAAPAFGPRGPVGPDVPVSDAEKAQFARRVTVEGLTSAAVQAACDRAAREGIAAVFLPPGEYVMEAEVRIPGGLTILGEGARTLCRTARKDARLFRVDGDRVRLTRLKLQGADLTPATDNDTHGIDAAGKKDVRVDHCELLGFSYAMNFSDEATVQVDHCAIHDNTRDGLGYGVAIYSGAYVLVCDNEFSQCRHALASNGALDWSSPKRVGKYVHKPGVQKTHWEFIRNRVSGDDRTKSRLCVVDTHPGMDGTFVVEGNLFENIRHGVGIRDGAGVIRGNLFRNLTGYRPVAISIEYGTHNNIVVEGTMPRDIQVSDNTFQDVGERVFGDGIVGASAEHVKIAKYRLGKAENITIDGKVVPETRVEGRTPPAVPRLQAMGADGVLRWK
ncbi:MAG: right-handed parallel beta-helix repeat-containing protein [Planctomycetes bacterium]|nr:right-handed parallel beta-helix repeat-containing protein [Planctomycetota bacterium]